HHRQAAVTEFQVATFGVELRPVQALDDRVGLVTRVDRDAGVAGPFRVVIAAVIALGAEDRIAELVNLRLGFLHADDVRRLALHPVEEALAGRGTDTVGVDGSDFHEGTHARQKTACIIPDRSETATGVSKWLPRPAISARNFLPSPSSATCCASANSH